MEDCPEPSSKHSIKLNCPPPQGSIPPPEQPFCRPQLKSESESEAHPETESITVEEEQSDDFPSCESANKINVPDDLQDVIVKFSIAFLVEQPGNTKDDVIDFAVDYFSRLQYKPIDSRTTIGSEIEVVEHLRRNTTQRRKSVFAEAYDPESDEMKGEDLPFFEKTEEQRNALHEAVKGALLFKQLEIEQMNQVLDAMFEKPVKNGEIIIKQGADGDNFYIIESGIYNVFKNHNLVYTYDNSGSFGELALLYNMPRAATVQAETDGLLWAVDRTTFRKILLRTAFNKRKTYETLLDTVPILRALQPHERMNLADSLVTISFKHDEKIIQWGDTADGMYFIEEGKVSVRIEQDQSEMEVNILSKGQYFGELALVNNRPRAASVYAIGDVKVAFLRADAFNRILGFLTDVLKRNAELYEEHFQKLARQTSRF